MYKALEELGVEESIIYKNEEDLINHPSHYTFGSIEPIEVIEDWKLGFHLGNAVKYIARAGKKDSAKQDLEKAIFYINRHIVSQLEEVNNGI